MKISLCMYRNDASEPEKLGVQIESEYPTYVLTMEGDIIHPHTVSLRGDIFTHTPEVKTIRGVAVSIKGN